MGNGSGDSLTPDGGRSSAFLTHTALGKNLFTWRLGCFVITWRGWKSRLYTLSLLVGPVFSMVFIYSIAVIIWKFSLSLCCPFPGLLARESRLSWVFICIQNFWVVTFSSSQHRICETRRKSRELTTVLFLGSPDLLTSLLSSLPPFIVFLCLFYASCSEALAVLSRKNREKSVDSIIWNQKSFLYYFNVCVCVLMSLRHSFTDEICLGWASK